jgi:uncharacterized protein with FMN-binding domain
MEENNTTNSSSGGSKKGLIIAAVAVIVILAIAAGGFAFMNMNKTTSDQAQETAVESAETQAKVSPEAESEESASVGTYKDGTYTATGTYSYHSGTESIGVTVTLSNGVVEEVSVEKMAKAPASVKMQDDFIANFEPMVVGKNIDDVNLGKVSGSSLTPIGFNAAIEDIKSQSQS